MSSFLSNVSTRETISSREFIEMKKEEINKIPCNEMSELPLNKNFSEEERKENFLDLPKVFPAKRRCKSRNFKVEIPERDPINNLYSQESRILPNLYLGGTVSGDKVFLDNPLRIKLVINLDHTKLYSNHLKEGVEVVNIPVFDDSDSTEELLEMCSGPEFIRSDVRTWFKRIFYQMDEYLGAKKGVLVHCFAGASRSATVVIAYLMYRRMLSFDTAYKFVKERRYETSPNIGFHVLLSNYGEMLREFRFKRSHTSESLNI